MGTTNVDRETGIHFGVIPIHELNEWAWESFESDYGDPACPKCGGEVIDMCDEDAPDTDNYPEHRGCDDYACTECVRLYDSAEVYGEDPVGHTLDEDGYVGTLDTYNDVFLTKSPFFTHAQFCSPCAPGAGHLSNPCTDGPKTYCFGHDWFTNDTAPYPVYRVDTGELVKPTAAGTCPRCGFFTGGNVPPSCVCNDLGGEA